LRIKAAHLPPEFLPLRVEEDKSGSEFKTINWREFLADMLLNVEADERNLVV
jgi:hypothetical protein